ncbi:MAG TPA: HAD-IA family hydrolase, partial [Candidatus Omnitrophota bacterium]|nr:HAD-IA family hydrolase [Candidatus Omnitrophota bacterium]
REDLKKALFLYRKHHRQDILRYSRLFPGVITLLKRLKNRGLKLAIASNRPTEFTLGIIRHLRISSYLDLVLCADKLKHIKPHPEILNKIIEKFSLTKSQALYIGDMIIDLQAARRAKIKGIAVTTGSSTRDELKKEAPWRIISKITQLLKIV